LACSIRIRLFNAVCSCSVSVAAVDGALLQQPDGGHVGQGLADAQRGRVQHTRIGVEEIQRADHLIAQAHGQCVDGGEAHLGGGKREPRPAAGRRQVGDRHRLHRSIDGSALLLSLSDHLSAYLLGPGRFVGGAAGRRPDP
jgi:hypothetical protein